VASLILLRHGRSEWNERNLFTGWIDVDLDAAGEGEARRSGRLLHEHGLLPDVVHTSVLRRAIRTADIALDAASRSWIPVRRSWRLNERHYGALQGKNRVWVRERYGDQQYTLWRRSYETPPPLALEHDALQPNDGRYRQLGGALPQAESLRDVFERLLPYWLDALVPDLRAGRRVFVSAHGNSLRALIKYLDGLSDYEVLDLNVPTGIPLHYELDDATMLPRRPGVYLDPAMAAEAIAATAALGRH
jgi:2,3-bisphosphoglycerate-dependent phosphoglycerate mutase